MGPILLPNLPEVTFLFSSKLYIFSVSENDLFFMSTVAAVVVCEVVELVPVEAGVRWFLLTCGPQCLAAP